MRLNRLLAASLGCAVVVAGCSTTSKDDTLPSCSSCRARRRQSADRARRLRGFARTHRGEHPHARVVRHAQLALRYRIEHARHRRRAPLDQERARALLAGYGVEGRVRRAPRRKRRARAQARELRERRRHAARHAGREPRSHLSRERSLRLDALRSHRRQDRCARRQRRRIGHRSLHGARLRHVEAQVRRDARLHGGVRRRAGPVWIDRFRESREGEGPRHRRHVHQRHRRQHPRTRRQREQGAACASSPRESRP